MLECFLLNWGIALTLALLLGLSEALDEIPSVKSNSVHRLIKNILVYIGTLVIFVNSKPISTPYLFYRSDISFPSISQDNSNEKHVSNCSLTMSNKFNCPTSPSK